MFCWEKWWWNMMKQEIYIDLGVPHFQKNPIGWNLVLCIVVFVYGKNPHCTVVFTCFYGFFALVCESKTVELRFWHIFTIKQPRVVGFNGPPKFGVGKFFSVGQFETWVQFNSQFQVFLSCFWSLKPPKTNASTVIPNFNHHPSWGWKRPPYFNPPQLSWAFTLLKKGGQLSNVTELLADHETLFHTRWLQLQRYLPTSSILWKDWSFHKNVNNKFPPQCWG